MHLGLFECKFDAVHFSNAYEVIHARYWLKMLDVDEKSQNYMTSYQSKGMMQLIDILF